MKPTEVKEFLRCMLPMHEPVFLWGAPGIGKSSIVRQVAEEQGGGFVDLRPASLDPVDVRGIPTVTKAGKAIWAKPTFFPDSGSGVFFIDELPQAPVEVQNTLLELALDRRIGEHELPDGWAVVAAGNRATDRAGAGKLTSALSSRFIHIDLHLSMDDWQGWAAANDVHPLVRGFVQFRPQMLHDFRPERDERNFPCPRSWVKVSSILKSGAPERLNKSLLHEALTGAVSASPAQEFIAFMEFYSKIPNLDDLLANPAAAMIPTEPSLAWALCVALAERVGGKDFDAVKELRSWTQYVTRLKTDLATFCMVAAFRHHDRAMSSGKVPEAMEWIRKNAHKLNAGRRAS